jgi:hypothetical protein
MFKFGCGFVPAASLTGAEGFGCCGLGSAGRPRSDQSANEDTAGAESADTQPPADAFEQGSEEVVGC